MKCKNYVLAEKQAEIETYDEEKAAKIACYEAIGLEVYKKYGHDCFDYDAVGLPVDIDFIEKEMKNAQSVGMGINLPPCAIYAWAKILVTEYWEKYPNGIKEWKTEMNIKELKGMVEALPPTGIEIYINDRVAKDWKDITISNINDCSITNRPQSLLNDVGMRLHEHYGIIIHAPIIINGEKYKIEYNYL